MPGVASEGFPAGPARPEGGDILSIGPHKGQAHSHKEHTFASKYMAFLLTLLSYTVLLSSLCI